MNIEKLLREAAAFIDVDWGKDLRARLTAAADHVAEHAAEYKLAEWLAKDADHSVGGIYEDPDTGKWLCDLLGDAGNGDDRSAAILAALKAWEERK